MQPSILHTGPAWDRAGRGSGVNYIFSNRKEQTRGTDLNSNTSEIQEIHYSQVASFKIFWERHHRLSYYDCLAKTDS